MSIMKDSAILTQKYLKEVHNRILTIEEILLKPHWEQVYMHWKACEHYNGFVITLTKEECKAIYGE